MRRLVRRVLLSGYLMLFITAIIAVERLVLFHPTGYAFACGLMSQLVIVNSLLQIESFKPASGAPIGPIRETLRAFKRRMRHLARHSSATSNPLMHDDANAGQALPISGRGGYMLALRSVVRGIDHRGETLLRSYFMASSPSVHRRSIRTRTLSEQSQAAPVGDQLRAWERPGVIACFLASFVRVHNITPDMTAIEVTERFIKPETALRKCCFVELLASDDRCPPQWLGKPTHFTSHW